MKVKKFQKLLNRHRFLEHSIVHICRKFGYGDSLETLRGNWVVLFILISAISKNFLGLFLRIS